MSNFSLGPPTEPKDPRFLQWLAVLWQYIRGLTLTGSFSGEGTSTTVLHGNATGSPTWGPVVLETDVSGILSEKNAPPQDNVGSKLYAYYNCGGF